MLSPTKATLLCFPQKYEAGKIFLNLLFLPREDPFLPFTTNLPVGTDAPPFTEAFLKFAARIIPSLEALPDPSAALAPIKLITDPPTDTLSIFTEFKSLFSISLSSNELQTPPKETTFIRKYLPLSYRNAIDFSHPRSSKYAVTDDAYLCALKKPASTASKTLSSGEMSWGKVVALILRQPALARKAGLLYSTSLSLPAADTFSKGGWLYIELAGDSDYYEQQSLLAPLVRKYAARIPALSQPRSLFAAVQFLATTGTPAGNYDTLFEDAIRFDDGFANIVHCTQPQKANMILEPDQPDLPPTKDLGIRIGWEDEQILEWYNRLLTRPDQKPAVGPTSSGPASPDAPLGILAYRIDVRNQNNPDLSWHSLNKVKGQLKLGQLDLGRVEGELGVEVGPVQLEGLKEGQFWLPSYFAQWDGASVVLSDPRATELFDLSGREKIYEAVDTDKVPLKYGETYEFRVRMADITGGGPDENSEPELPVPTQIASCRFRRFVPPGEVRINGDIYTIYRPLLSYPSLLYTGLQNGYSLLLADLPKAKLERREPGFPDPDVAELRIEVMVEGPQLDTALSPDPSQSYYFLYRTSRPFPDDPEAPLQLTKKFVDAPKLKFDDPADLGSFPLPAEQGELLLPSARKIKLILTPICKADPTLAYFGTEQARFGRPVEQYAYAASEMEPKVFVEDDPSRQCKGIFLRPDEQNPAMPIKRLAAALDLQSKGLQIFSQPGQRILFGCAKEIRHSLSPERSSIRFSSTAELLQQWIVAVMITVDRDWSWKGLQESAFTIKRNGREIGTIEDPRVANEVSLQDPKRHSTSYIFLDAIDPTPRNDEFPDIVEPVYSIQPNFINPAHAGTATITATIRLPVAVRPAQVPKLVSAGVALSPYERDPLEYTWTAPRHKMLWLEFEEPVLDPHDSLFVYIKAASPDPKLLADPEELEGVEEQDLYMDPEYVRVIVPGQSEDKAGLHGRQLLLPADSVAGARSRHFLIPLPPGVSPDAPELFGFFVYDICIGHSNIWSTVQARFGRSIRLSGVQHPAPALICSTYRDKNSVRLSAPFARATHNGKNLTRHPMTELWGLLYAQVKMTNGEDQRNILLARRQMRHLESDHQMKQYNGYCEWTNKEIALLLDEFGLSNSCTLSCLAIELFPNNLRDADPLGADLGYTRILRSSQLEPVSDICCADC